MRVAGLTAKRTGFPNIKFLDDDFLLKSMAAFQAAGLTNKFEVNWTTQIFISLFEFLVTLFKSCIFGSRLRPRFCSLLFLSILHPLSCLVFLILFPTVRNKDGGYED